MNSRPHTPRPGAQRGAAALIVVLLLFFIISLVAAYAGRNLIFEQRTSANQYRATQAFEAAEAGLEWALAMLNGGRINANCAASTVVADQSFRERFLQSDAADPNPKGLYEPRTWVNAGATERLRPSCVRTDDPNDPNYPWSCSCRTDSPPVLAAPGGNGVFPAFRVCLERVPLDPLVPLGPVQPGAVRIVATGHTRFVDQPCEQRGEGTDGEAAATVSVVVALSSALATPPNAAVTVGGYAIVGNNARVGNTYAPSNGLTINAGGVATVPNPDVQLITVPGSPAGSSFVDEDDGLGALTPHQLFTSVFRMHPDTYERQPAAVVVDCSDDCANRLQAAVSGNPGRIIWVDGALTLASDVELGTVEAPAIIVVNGGVSIIAPARVIGLLHSQANITITADLDLRGAIIGAGNVTVDGPSTIAYDAEILRRLNLSSGSLVRVPGSWRDFP